MQIIHRVPRTESTPGKANVQCYNCNEKGHYARECQKPKVHDAKYFREQMLLAIKDEAGSNLSNEENDFMLDTSYGEDLEELTADDNAENVPSYDPFVENNGGTSEHDSTAHDEYREIQMLAYNVQREAENKKCLNNELKKQKDLLQQELKTFKDRVKIFESKTIQYSTYKETCDELERELRNDKDTIDRLKAFKEREDRYLDDILDLEEKLSSHDQIVYKMAGLGYTNPERLKKAIAAQLNMYDELSSDQTYFSIPSTSDNGSIPSTSDNGSK
ncbi:putative ribonuclease H-like domain-containing protein [Tanacetum coccineum]